jgi:hypothetical protein
MMQILPTQAKFMEEKREMLRNYCEQLLSFIHLHLFDERSLIEKLEETVGYLSGDKLSLYWEYFENLNTKFNVQDGRSLEKLNVN